ncbi:winged helix-turn-helix transcriptional regulator [Nonomuraea basaltis]|uniref:winged helix-turn-helix transcriptional regulator n=1 Tax=Nonomuraea basaltis TaxID=2495887 RepID=UPI00110C5ECC|nr:helix-turn-helix domain-containing protein [Nonomuraea basaltis]TMR91717.1 helix-turn-helix transcriptional regulator [Nonomuraea basaltis]
MRTYDDPCGVARALDHVGERWALLIVRELLLGPKRFTDLRTGLPTASQNVLSQRLRELEASGLVRRRKLPPPAAAWVYELTGRGMELEPVVLVLARWGSRMPMSSTNSLSPDALAFALRSTFDAEAARGFEGRIELRLGEDRFLAEVSPAGFELTRDTRPEPDATLETDADTLRALAFTGCSLDTDGIRVEGDKETVRRFLTLFPRPAAMNS